MPLAIKAENVSKAYQIGEFSTGSLTKDIERAWYKLRGKEDPFLKIGETNDRSKKGESDIVWSLKDIDFEIQQGDAVGIIGRNGAGKSTLLKILSRVTTPTIGKINVKGRIASLLEVGTGFHPELTGRENIFLNGAILGMRKHEIKSKFDEIVDFAGVERYIDTPVKRYSSGMYVRLAFAVAAHLENEILVIDEVLAVGDAEFQNKCLGKMNNVSKEEGRTVLFVSHQLNSISNLCNKAILMNMGRIEDYNYTNHVISKYLTRNTQISSTWHKTDDTYHSPFFSPTRFACVNAEFHETGLFSNNDKIGVEIEGDVMQTDAGYCIGFAVYNADNTLLFWSLNTDVEFENWPTVKIGKNRIVGWIPPHLLNEGEYRVEILSSIHHKEWFCKPEYSSPVIFFRIKGGLSNSPHWQEARPGILAPINKFNLI